MLWRRVCDFILKSCINIREFEALFTKVTTVVRKGAHESCNWISVHRSYRLKEKCPQRLIVVGEMSFKVVPFVLVEEDLYLL